MALLQARMPHTLARPDVPRWLAGRKHFGNTLALGADAFERGDAAGLRAHVARLADALRGWMDAELGLAAETAV